MPLKDIAALPSDEPDPRSEPWFDPLWYTKQGKAIFADAKPGATSKQIKANDTPVIAVPYKYSATSNDIVDYMYANIGFDLQVSVKSMDTRNKGTSNLTIVSKTNWNINLSGEVSQNEADNGAWSATVEAGVTPSNPTWNSENSGIRPVDSVFSANTLFSNLSMEDFKDIP